MDTFMTFLQSHHLALIRLFFGLATALDAVFIYAAVFDRDLPRRLAVWFFGSLVGQPVRIERSEDKTPLANWICFAIVSAVPPVAWVVFELCFA